MNNHAKINMIKFFGIREVIIKIPLSGVYWGIYSSTGGGIRQMKKPLPIHLSMKWNILNGVIMRSIDSISRHPTSLF